MHIPSRDVQSTKGSPDHLLGLALVLQSDLETPEIVQAKLLPSHDRKGLEGFKQWCRWVRCNAVPPYYCVRSILGARYAA